MSSWLNQVFRKDRQGQPKPISAGVIGWGQADCDDCQAGRVYSFGWRQTRIGNGDGDWPSVNPDTFVLEKQLRTGALYSCSACGSSWYCDLSQSVMNAVMADRVPLILEWSEQPLPLERSTEDILCTIGRTPPDLYGNGSQYEVYPCAITTKSGDFHPIALISKQRHAPFEQYREYRLGSEIVAVEPSNYALPLEVRLATSRADEVRMGFAPTILETQTGTRLTANWTINFLKMAGVEATQVAVSADQSYFSDTPPIVEEPKPVCFIVDS